MGGPSGRFTQEFVKQELKRVDADANGVSRGPYNVSRATKGAMVTLAVNLENPALAREMLRMVRGWMGKEKTVKQDKMLRCYMSICDLRGLTPDPNVVKLFSAPEKETEKSADADEPAEE